MMRTRRTLCTGLLLVAVAAALPACGGGPKKTPLKMTLNADEGINPSAGGEPSPVVVTVYQLKSLRAFDNADFFDFADDTKLLGSDLISSREFELTPGSTEEYDNKISADAAYIGVVAAFREIQSAQWRDSVELRKGKKNKFRITLTRLSVSIDKQKGRFMGMF